MADTAPAAPAPSTPSPASESASDTALFAKFTAQHEAAVAKDLEAPSADASTNANRGAATVRAVAQKPAGAAAARAAGDAAGREDAGGDGDTGGDGGQADDAGAAPGGRPDDAADKAPAGGLSEADAVALLRKARDEGDAAGIDRALKVLMPGSKGASEFAVNGKRYAEFRTANKRAQKQLDEREASLTSREQNLQRGQAVLEQVVQRLQPLEALVLKAERGEPDAIDAIVEFAEKASKRKFNDIAKAHLEKKLGKQADPEIEALRNELRAERTAREEREKKEREAREQGQRTEQIRRHLVFLDETLSKAEDQRFRALVKTPEGMRAIFEAQQKHFDPRTNTTLSAEQAAAYVLNQKAKELEPWRVVLGGASPSAPTTPAASSPATPPADRARTLGSRGGAPASGGSQRLSDTELFEKYERLAKLAGD